MTIITALSCSKKTEIAGYWRYDFNQYDSIDNVPDELMFYNDSLVVIRYLFKQNYSFESENDSIQLITKNGKSSKFYCKLINDSLLNFDNCLYRKLPSEQVLKTPTFDLLGWPAAKEIDLAKDNDVVIRLFKINGSIMVGLNDGINDIRDIRMFLFEADVFSPKIYVFVGKDITMNELIDVYCWVRDAGNGFKIELITDSNFFEKFYSVSDRIRLDSIILKEFFRKNNLPPFPFEPEVTGEPIIDINVYSEDDFVVRPKSDTIIYQFNFSTELELTKYLQLSEIYNDLKFKKLKKIKRFPLRHNVN